MLEKVKYHLFVGIDRASKYVYYELYDKMSIENSERFLKNLIEDCPFKINKILTDNGIQFTYELLALHLRPKNEAIHPFDKICITHNIEHRLTQFRHPWTNGQVEIMNKIIKNHTVKSYHYETVEELKKHLMSFLLFYNHQKKLKSLKFKSPYDILLERFSKKPEFFKTDPNHKLAGLNT